jgi:hypothetical protein
MNKENEKVLEIYFTSKDIEYLLKLIDDGLEFKGLFGAIVEEWNEKEDKRINKPTWEVK